jgi:hypothetical protein
MNESNKEFFVTFGLPNFLIVSRRFKRSGTNLECVIDLMRSEGVMGTFLKDDISEHEIKIDVQNM